MTASMTDHQPTETEAALRLMSRIDARSARIGIIGLGYVGLPLALTFEQAGFPVLGFDISDARAEAINRGEDLINYLEPGRVGRAVLDGRFLATCDMARLAEVDCILICVPTPLTRHAEPDLSFIRSTTLAIAKTLRHGQLIVLESTTWPGTTKEVVQPLLEAMSGLVCGQDFFLGFSPEREDPGNAYYSTRTIPKIVGADDASSRRLSAKLYGAAIESVVPVESAATAEAVKLTENIFRSVNIALVNELKLIYGTLGIDIWSVIDAAATKPFGYMPFYPGPGLGGHCIPIDPFYLTWKAREQGIETRFIELAGLVNARMPKIIVDRLAQSLMQTCNRPLDGASILVAGIAYKKNINDLRESPALEIMELIIERGGRVNFTDPHIAEVPPTREHPLLTGLCGIDLGATDAGAFDAVVLATDHDVFDYPALARGARLIIDTRNAFGKRRIRQGNIVAA